MSRLGFALSLLSCLAAAATGKSPGYSETLEVSPQNTIPRTEKLTHIHFFWHDILTGANLSAVAVVPPSPPPAIQLVHLLQGSGPDLSSGIIGRAPGLYTLASQEEVALLMAMNLVFTEGEYEGSTLTVLGRNSISMKVREMPVIGGIGAFRFTRGYVHARTYQFDSKTGSAIVEYDVHVGH